MAKKIKAAEIIITTTDGGSFKVTGAAARKLAKEMGGLGGAAQGTDRRIKGVTQQSSNATKNFSKQAQTMQGGIVAVYATIAAQVFAVSAAFQFMKSSFETRNLIEGQKAFGSVTGVAYKTLTSNIQAATDGMLQFKEAASSVAIGVAAGLAGGQLERLAGAAKNASLALGRDLTDSFNRLIRGVTKAEPELLDELGIILRLENATRNYALEVGKARDDLNAYERTQAVLNDVLEQAETKYGAIAEIMDPDAFALGQLTKEFDDIVMVLQEFMVKALLPLIQFFKENASALAAAMGLFVLPIINKLLPDLDKSVLRSKENMGIAMGGMKEAAADASNEFKATFAASKDVGKARTDSSTGLKDMGVKFKKDSPDQLNARQIAAYKRHMKDKTGIYKKFNVQERAAFKRHLAMQEATLRKSGKVQVSLVQRTESAKQVAIKTTEVVFKAAEAAKLRVAAIAASAMNKLMAFMGVVGIIMMVVAAVMQLWNWFKNLDEAAKKAREETERLTEQMGSLAEELDGMVDVRGKGLVGLVDGIQQTSNALKSYDMAKQLKDIASEMDKFEGSSEDWAKSDFAKNASHAASALEILAPEMSGFSDAIKKMDKDKMALHKNTWYLIAMNIINASEALKRYQENQKAIDKQVEKTIGRMAKLPFQDILNPLTSAINDFALAMERLDNRQQEMQNIVKFRETGAPIDQAVTKEFTNPAQTRVKYTFDKELARKNAEEAVKYMQEYSNLGGTESSRKSAFDSLGFKGGMFSYQGDDFETDEQLIQAITEAQLVGIHGAKSKEATAAAPGGRTNFEAMAAALGPDPAAAAEAKAKWEEATLEIRQMVRANENNIFLQTEMLSIQAQSIALDKKKISDQQTLADVGIGSTRAVKEAKNAYKVTQQANKEEKANIDFRVAGTNKDLEGRKLVNQMDEFAISNKTVMDDLDKKSIDLEYIKSLEKKKQAFLDGTSLDDLSDSEKIVVNNLANQIRAVENAGLAVDNAKALVTLEGQKTTNAEAQEIWANKLLNIQERQVDIAFKKLGLQAELNRLKRLETTEVGGGVFGYALARQQFENKGSAITAKQTQNTSEITASAKNLKDEYGIDTGAADFDITKRSATYGTAQETEADKELQTYIKLQEVKTGLDADELNHGLTKQNFATKLLGTENELLQSKRDIVLTLNPAQEIFDQKRLAHIKKFGDAEGFNADEVARLSVEQASLNIELELMSGIQSTLKNGFVSMFQSLIDGSKSFKDSMKDLAKSVIADLAAMYLKAAALKFMMAFMPGGEAVTSFLKGSRYGGIRSPSFAGGGVAQGPSSGYQAMLHGTEAVVPLGNDRSIPVDIRGAQGNTVNVAVNISGQGSSTQSTGAGDAAALGRSIGGLVQQHLQTEMRPGGLLNRQGANGRGGG